jgi:tRNA U55 pseudouridine synthase TruB
MIHNLYKQRGETPLECIKRLVTNNPDLKGQKMTYLGRLDPLAEGVLLIASGDDVKRKEEFLGLDKEYDFISLFGFATDTYDVLGKILRVEKVNDMKEMDLIKICKIYEGEREQKYPMYSSKMISVASQKSKSLEQTGYFPAEKSPPSRASRAPKVALETSFLPIEDMPSKKITVHKIQFHKLDALSGKELFGRLLMDISKVKGDFRQHEILILWKEYLFGSELDNSYFLGKFSAHVSSGTYIRGLVNDIGNTLGCGATTLSIKRNRVGDYKIEDSIK